VSSRVKRPRGINTRDSKTHADSVHRIYPPHDCGLRSSGMLRSVGWYSLADVRNSLRVKGHSPNTNIHGVKCQKSHRGGSP
jgi:hypothetical protein